jgi:hypothetical protein
MIAASPPGRPLLVNLTATHHRIADMLEAYPETSDLWQSVTLPCRDCGCVFVANRRALRYRRTCGECLEPVGTALADSHGSPHLLVAGALGGRGYRKARRTQPAHEREAAAALGTCAECGAPFWTTSSQQRYCETHQSAAARVSRHRRGEQETSA